MSTINTYSDEDLAELIKLAIPESSIADFDQAFTLLFHRHKNFLLYSCRKFVVANKLPNSMAEEIFSEFLFKVGDRSNSIISKFDRVKSRSKTPFLSWAMRVLSHLAIDMAKKHALRSKHEVLLPDTAWEGICLSDDVHSSTEPLSSKEKHAIDIAFNKLSDRDQSIIRDYYIQKPISKTNRSPKGVYEDIAIKHETTKENVKKIISRFVNGVELEVKE